MSIEIENMNEINIESKNENIKEQIKQGEQKENQERITPELCYKYFQVLNKIVNDSIVECNYPDGHKAMIKALNIRETIMKNIVDKMVIEDINLCTHYFIYSCYTQKVTVFLRKTQKQIGELFLFELAVGLLKNDTWEKMYRVIENLNISQQHFLFKMLFFLYTFCRESQSSFNYPETILNEFILFVEKYISNEKLLNNAPKWVQYKTEELNNLGAIFTQIKEHNNNQQNKKGRKSTKFCCIDSCDQKENKLYDICQGCNKRFHSKCAYLHIILPEEKLNCNFYCAPECKDAIKNSNIVFEIPENLYSDVEDNNDASKELMELDSNKYKDNNKEGKYLTRKTKIKTANIVFTEEIKPELKIKSSKKLNIIKCEDNKDLSIKNLSINNPIEKKKKEKITQSLKCLSVNKQKQNVLQEEEEEEEEENKMEEEEENDYEKNKINKKEKIKPSIKKVIGNSKIELDKPIINSDNINGRNSRKDRSITFPCEIEFEFACPWINQMIKVKAELWCFDEGTQVSAEMIQDLIKSDKEEKKGEGEHKFKNNMLESYKQLFKRHTSAVTRTETFVARGFDDPLPVRQCFMHRIREVEPNWTPYADLIGSTFSSPFASLNAFGVNKEAFDTWKISNFDGLSLKLAKDGRRYTLCNLDVFQPQTSLLETGFRDYLATRCIHECREDICGYDESNKGNKRKTVICDDHKKVHLTSGEHPETLDNFYKIGFRVDLVFRSRQDLCNIIEWESRLDDLRPPNIPKIIISEDPFDFSDEILSEQEGVWKVYNKFYQQVKLVQHSAVINENQCAVNFSFKKQYVQNIKFCPAKCIIFSKEFIDSRDEFKSQREFIKNVKQEFKIMSDAAYGIFNGGKKESPLLDSRKDFIRKWNEINNPDWNKPSLKENETVIQKQEALINSQVIDAKDFINFMDPYIQSILQN